MIDSREFKVFDEDRSEILPLDSKLRDLSYITGSGSGSNSSPVLVLESEIFRTAEEVEIEERVTRVRKGTGAS